MLAVANARAGHRVSRSHVEPLGVKTDAPFKVQWDVLRCWVRRRGGTLDRHEPMNAALFYKVARPFARIAGRAPAILSQTLSLIEKAVRLSPNKAELLLPALRDEAHCAVAHLKQSRAVSCNLEHSHRCTA